MKGIGIYLMLFFCILPSFHSFFGENSKGIREIWQELYLNRDYGDKCGAVVLFNFLHNNDVDHYSWFAEGQVNCLVRKWLEDVAIYRREYYQLDSLWTYRSRPPLRFSGNVNIGNWNNRKRHRFEYRKFENGVTQLRNGSDLQIIPT